MSDVANTKPVITKETPIFLKIISSVTILRILTSLLNGSLRYSEILETCEFTKMNSGKFAYHLRRARQIGLIQLTSRTKQYYLTFKGRKTYELLSNVEKIANMSIENLPNRDEQIFISLDASKTWLEPLLKSEIRKITRQINRKTVFNK